MKLRCILLAATVCLATAAASRAFDSMVKTSGTVVGDVKGVGRYEVEFVRSGVPEKVPTNEILTIYFEDEPNLMKTSRNHVIEGRYQDAQDALMRVKVEDFDRPELNQDLDFYQAFCAARLALGGSGTIKEAGLKMRTFL